MKNRMKTILSIGCIIMLSVFLEAQIAVQNPDFEQGKKGWTPKTGFQASVKIGKHKSVHGGKQSAHLIAARAVKPVSISQNVGQLKTGLYELTTWASGKGKLRLIVRDIASRKFNVSDNGWQNYSLIFDIPDPTDCTIAIQVIGNVFIDDILLKPADDERKEAWKKQILTQEQFGFIPSGYSAQRPDPAAKTRDTSLSNKVVAPIINRIIFYDPKYDNSWVNNPDKVAKWFSERGFTVKSAVATAEWMKERLKKEDAYGSVAVMCMGLVPGLLIKPDSDTCLLKRYLEAGGRVVWMGDTSLYVAQDEQGSRYSNGALMSEILDVTCDSAKWLGKAKNSATPNGKAWGLTGQGSCIRGVRKDEVTLSLSENSSEGCSAIWLKTLNPDYPLSGFISSVHSVDGKNETTFDYFYKLALFTGKPVAIPKTESKSQTKKPLQYKLVIQGGDTKRKAFVRGETASFKIAVDGASSAETLDVTLKVVPEAPSMKTYDLAKFDIKPYKQELADFRERFPSITEVYSKKISFAPSPGKTSESEVLAFETKDLAVGNYEVHAKIKSTALPEPVEIYEPLAICAKPNFDRILRYIRGGNPSNIYRLYGYVDDIIKSGLDTGPSAKVTQPLPDIMLIKGKTFMTALETCHCLVENRTTPNGKGWPNPWGGGRPGLPALAGKKAKSNVYDYAFTCAKRLGGYPAFARVFECNDDWSARGGWDYNKNNTAEFKAKTGLDAPVPEEFKKVKLPTRVNKIARPAGIIDDKDPWLLWNTFLCRDVFGGLNDAERRAVCKGAPGSLIWMVPGGAQWPLFSVSSGLYPPYNFGSKYGLNAVGYYTYYDYWAPTLKYLYASEMGRMANRDLQSWVMPDAGGDARHYIRNMTHLLLAAGVHGLNYFAYSPGYFGKEGRLEHANLGQLMDAHGSLLYRLSPAPKRVGLLVPFSEAIFNTAYGQWAGGLFCDMVMGHIDVEPVAEEEIDECKHKVIALWKIKHLKQSSVTALENYIQRGGIVLMDKDCEVPIKGARKLDISFGKPSNNTYGKSEGINNLKKIFAFIGKPEFDSPEKTTVIRSFVSPDGIKYAYAVQVDDYDEYQFWWKNIYLAQLFRRKPKLSPEEIDSFKREHGMGTYLKDSTITVQFDPKLLPENGQVIDVFRGEILPVNTDSNGRMGVTTTIRKFGGTLLAFLPSEIDHVKINSLVNGKERKTEKGWFDFFDNSVFTAKPGETIDFTIKVCDKKGKPIPGLQSIVLTLTKPDGSIEKEITMNRTTEKGVYKLSFTPARNHPDGKWTLKVKELLTGKQDSLQFKVSKK